MFQSKIFSYKFNSFHDEERREGALGLKITSIQEEEVGGEEAQPGLKPPAVICGREDGHEDLSARPEPHKKVNVDAADFFVFGSRMETKRKIGRVDAAGPALLQMLDPIKEVVAGDTDAKDGDTMGDGNVGPFERQDSGLSTVSSFSEVDLDEFYVEECPPEDEDEEDEVAGGEGRSFLLGESFLSFLPDSRRDSFEVLFIFPDILEL